MDLGQATETKACPLAGKSIDLPRRSPAGLPVLPATAQAELERLRLSARALGVAAEFAQQLPLARKIAAALQLVRGAGYALPDRILVDAEHFAQLGPSYAGQFDSMGQGIEGPDICTVYLNPNYYWDVPSPVASTKHHLHQILHELGHAAHYRQNPNYFICFCKVSVPASVLAKVSAYAEHCGCAKEFVAEVFVKRVLAYPLPTEVDEAYHRCNGPLAAGEKPRAWLRPAVPHVSWSDEPYYFRDRPCQRRLFPRWW